MPHEKLNFLIDTQLPPVLASFLKRKGFDAVHTTKVKENGQFMSDLEIIALAIENHQIIITKDKDFVDYYFSKGYPPKILQLQLGNTKNDDLIDLLDANIETIKNFFMDSSKLVILSQDAIVTY